MAKKRRNDNQQINTSSETESKDLAGQESGQTFSVGDVEIQETNKMETLDGDSSLTKPESFIAQSGAVVPDETKTQKSTVEERNLPYPEGMKEFYDNLMVYANAMGSHIMPKDNDMYIAQRRLQTLIMAQFKTGNALARLAFFIEFLNKDESGAFKPNRLMRGIGHRKCILKEEVTREWSVIIQALTLIAGGKAELVSIDKLSELILPENQEAVISVITRLTGSDTE